MGTETYRLDSIEEPDECDETDKQMYTRLYAAHGIEY